jgi:glycosyltransferase involved in cell wall biosynthesis
MSYGIPVVATKTGGTGELVLPGTGLLVPPEDPAGLADAMQCLLEDIVLAEKLGDSGRERAMEAHDIVRIASELAKAFESAKHGGRPASVARQCA